MAKRAKLGKRWCFTNPRSDDEAEERRQQLFENENVTAMIVEPETGKDEYEHWQGYVEWRTDEHQSNGL
jgi:hypothetical protein